MEREKLLGKIKKCFKKEKLYLELYLENYEEYNIYFRIDYFKKHKCYRLSWFDLNLMEIDDIEKYVSYEYVPDRIIDYISEITEKFNKNNKDYYKEENMDEIRDKVHLTINSKTKKSECLKITFYKFIPEEIKEIAEILSILFNTAPKKLQNFWYEMIASLNGEENKYKYKSKIKFNIFKDDLKQLFPEKVYDRGKKYYKEFRVLFLEKIDNRYFGVIGGLRDLYLCIVDYDEETNDLCVHCSCPCDYYCKHLCAMMMAIRDKRINRFLKIRSKKLDNNLLIKYMNFDFLLCVGNTDDKFIIVNNNGFLETVPIMNEDGKCDWEIIEDTPNNDLEKYIEKKSNKTDE